jgi:hypothetical protein
MAIDIASHENGQVTNLHGMGIDRRQPLLIEFDTQGFEFQMLYIWAAAQADQNTINHGHAILATHPHSAASAASATIYHRRIQISLFSKMQGKLAP